MLPVAAEGRWFRATLIAGARRVRVRAEAASLPLDGHRRSGRMPLRRIAMDIRWALCI